MNNVEKQNYFPGGAANIVNNLKSLGVGNVDVYGVIGNDPFGNELSRQLNQINCNIKNLLIQNVDWNTHTYSKPILNGNEINRMDFGVNNSLQNDTEDKLINALKKNINDYDLKLSGTGSTLFIEYDKKDDLKKILQKIPKNWRFFFCEGLQYSPLTGV